MDGAEFTDLYEILQLSPNADPDTVHRVYRLLAQRFHPDNHESGSAEAFRQITDAYKVLADPELRAAHDVERQKSRTLRWKIFDQTCATQGVEVEMRKRQGVISLLYRRRLAQPENGSMNLKELEDLLGVPREHLEFALWYLRESQCVQRSDNGRFSITLRGVDMAEAAMNKQPDTAGQRILQALPLRKAHA